MLISIPFGKGQMTGQVPDDAQVLRPGGGAVGSADQVELVRTAMAQPLGSPLLSQLAVGKATATIILSDHTRPVPSKVILPAMLAALREGNPDIQITLLVATGFHRATTRAELVEKCGEDIVAREHFVIHDSTNQDDMVELGTLPSGAPLLVNRHAVETDLLVSEGFIEPHFFAGFSGGRKSVLPGVCARETVLGNHCSAFIDSPFARTGNLEGNPLHRDMVAAAKMAHLQFIVNVAIDEEKAVIAAFAGDPFAAHEAGCAFVAEHAKVHPQGLSDIVITGNGGAPLDQNIYQTVKCLTAAEACAKEGGVLIACSACNDGAGGDGIYQALYQCESPQALMAEILQIPQNATQPDQWEYQILCRVLSHYHVILVCEPQIAQIVTDMKMTFAPTLDDALRLAREKTAPDASITVVPNGIAVIVEI